MRKKILLSWAWVGLCSLGIFLTVPVARSIQIYVTNKWGRELFGYFVLVSLFITFFSLLYCLVFKLSIRTISNYIWLFIIGGLYVYFTLKLWEIPEEAIHFVEYGLLGFFLFKALSHNVKDKSIYIIATLFALLIGTFDEIFQWITPRRYWDFRDAGLNALSGGLFQLAIWKVVRPKIISEKFNAKSLKIFSYVFAACLIIMGLCVSNTPLRVYRYSTLIPWLSFLQKEEAMSEFGYKIKDPDIGVFYSRLCPEELHKIDNQKGKSYAKILNESVDKNYQQFIQEYNPAIDPYMHELRVHIFRRDSHYKKAESASNPIKKTEFYFTAYKENLILNKYFTQSMRDSFYWWDEDEIGKFESSIDKNRHYESMVSANLFTSFSEKNIWIAIIILLSITALINFILPFLKILD